ncbi:Dihydroxyacetone synthase [Pestalotiopsis fici W106-1]|uniref:Dihydroxyacetone synthase n=1 Tax=Pestalotiopsis fici (strain W106-1 / CGMCC3.15140) TaxID=1229662 RepID=W3XJ52_PESFW|nr:Dihydroxyacetone synthase [Pestalotiopsis fici W106-1]ETS86054.1 Dihydroxyacetone synthase [Pestalotiopsis fici W106-1]
MVPGLVNETQNPSGIPVSKKDVISTEDLIEREKPSHDLVLKSFRLLIADLCQQFGGGHPGGAIGMAAIGIALWKYVMRYAPHSPDYFNRDRFVLSNGHTCLFQYTFLHLTGYKAMTFDQLKSYHSQRHDGLCPGHPEIEHEGIEVTTGPLGQGIANAVGLAMATKHLAATFNRPGYDVVSNHTWCMIGDACLQEGVGLEALSLAGHLQLNNLTVMYDNNQITCDGSVDLTNTEDINAKMRATGWNVVDIIDGCFDIAGIADAMEKSKKSDKPTFINIRTIIGLGSKVQGMADAHGAAFGVEDVANMKRAHGFSPDEHFAIAQPVRDFFEGLPSRGEQYVQAWNELVEDYTKEYPELAARFHKRMRGEITGWEQLIPKSFPEKETASRAASGLVFNPVAEKIDSFMVGTADLSPSVNMIWPGKEDFQNPNINTACGINGTYAGRYIHFGVREHVMCAVSNGLAAYNPGTIIPVTSSFFMFYLYAAPAVRMGALQHLQVIHHATHDSIGMGEDGPTHQPIENAVYFRSLPNFLYIRPGDSEETAGAWTAAIKAKGTPSMVSTSRHKLPQLKQTRRDGVLKGAYVLEENEHAQLTLIGVGAELSHALGVAKRLKERGVETRVVSFPSWRLFEQQSREYRRETLRRHRIPAVVIEPYAPNGWERYANAAVCMIRFGHSLPGTSVYKYFGFDEESLTNKVLSYLDNLKEDELLRHEFVEL